MRRFVLLLITVTVLLAAGCGGDDDVITADENGEIIVDMDEFSFGTDVIEVTAGQTVTFVLLNVGQNEHEFMIGRNLVETDLGYPNGFEHDFFESITPIVDPPSAGMDMGAMDDMGGMAMDDDEMAAMDDDEMVMDGDEMVMDDEEMAAMDDDEMVMDDEEMAAMDDDEMVMDDDEMAAMDDDEMAAMDDDDMGGMAMDDDEMVMDDDEMAAMDDDEMTTADGDHADDDEMPMDDDGLDTGDGDVHAGFMVQRRPGEVARLTVTISEDAVGTWEVGCFRGRGSHWDAGMRARLVVLAA